jgi:hypothetical protein
MNDKELLIDFIEYVKSRHVMPVLHSNIEPLVDDYLSSRNIGNTHVIRRQNWVCNSCGFSDYTDAVTEQELEEWLQCSNCGGDEFHLEPVGGGV